VTKLRQSYQGAGTRVPASSCCAGFRGAKLIAKTLRTWQTKPGWLLLCWFCPPTSTTLRSVENHFQERSWVEKSTADPSASSGFPVRLGGVGKPRAAFLKKAAHVAVDWCSVVGNPEFAPG
jgi:hypothetical protein